MNKEKIVLNNIKDILMRTPISLYNILDNYKELQELVIKYKKDSSKTGSGKKC